MCGVFGICGRLQAPGEASDIPAANAASPAGPWPLPAAHLTYLGLFALQHRGQESAGIAVSTWENGAAGARNRGRPAEVAARYEEAEVTVGGGILLRKDMGLVAEVFDREKLEQLPGSAAIGHVRYSTTGASRRENAQPLLGITSHGPVAIAHNGNFTNASSLRRRLLSAGAIFQTTTDTELLLALISQSAAEDLPQAVAQALQAVRGAYALVILGEQPAGRLASSSTGRPAGRPAGGSAVRSSGRPAGGAGGGMPGIAGDRPGPGEAAGAANETWPVLIGCRDPYGLRPLVVGERPDAYVLASETCALATVGATLVTELAPGEAAIITPAGLRIERWFPPRRSALCVFEYIYLARPDSELEGQSVHRVRQAIGRELAAEAPVEADVVIPAPDSGTSAALGYSQGSGIPFDLGLVKNRYVGRTFIQPDQAARELGVRIKLNPVRSVLAGRRVVVVDDSIVRGTTSRKTVALLREAGAKEVHLMIASPPYRYPCYYGVDTTDEEKLIARRHSVEEIRQVVGADSLHFVSLAGLLRAVRGVRGGGAGETEFDADLCTACFSGRYPTELPEGARPAKDELEREWQHAGTS